MVTVGSQAGGARMDENLHLAAVGGGGRRRGPRTGGVGRDQPRVSQRIPSRFTRARSRTCHGTQVRVPVGGVWGAGGPSSDKPPAETVRTAGVRNCQKRARSFGLTNRV
jgi:hypothetical protein